MSLEEYSKHRALNIDDIKSAATYLKHDACTCCVNARKHASREIRYQSLLLDHTYLPVWKLFHFYYKFCDKFLSVCV